MVSWYLLIERGREPEPGRLFFSRGGFLTQHRDGVTLLSKETIRSTESEHVLCHWNRPLVKIGASLLFMSLGEDERLGFCCAFPPVVQSPVSKFLPCLSVRDKFG